MSSSPNSFVTTSCIYTQGMNKTMETLDNIGIKLYVLAALKENEL